MRVPQKQVDEIVPDRSAAIARRWILGVAMACAVIPSLCGSITGCHQPGEGPSADETGKSSTHAVLDSESTGDLAPPEKIYSAIIRKPSGPPRIATGVRDLHGNEVTVACSTCHTTRVPNHQNLVAQDLDEFHAGMAFSHGTISCLSCHNDGDYDSLKLADGSRIEFTDVMTLCAQCHGPQMTAYEHGAHGGMTGYWDLNRGPRMKNNCIDCHDPHAPQFPSMKPTFKPRDRFLEPSRTQH